MNMKTAKILPIIIACCLLTALLSSLAHANVVAEADRTRLSIDETLTLTISRDSNSFFSKPDLDPLKNDFTVLGQSQSSNTQIINGSMTATTKWIVELAPKRAGKLRIPSLAVGNEQTAPISIRVDASPPPSTNNDGAPLYVETALDRQSVYVQSQLIFTIRIFWAVEAQINEPDDPVVSDALLEKLGDATYKKDINGQQYSVFERRYAIFPQKSGIFEIPSITVAALMPIRSHYSGFFDPFGAQGKRVKLRSNSVRATVLEKPPTYPGKAAWLPADTLSVEEQWSQNPQDLKVGESITVTITTTAKGLMATQLPPIAIAEADKIKLYQNTAEEKNSKDSTGVTGVRTETIALIPTEGGTLELPQIKIPWWNKQQQKVCYATAPAKRLVIHGSAATVNSVTPPLPEMTPPPQTAENKTVSPLTPPRQPLFWVLLCGGLGMAWLITTLLLLRTRRRLHGLASEYQAQPPVATTNTTHTEESAYKALGRACRQNDLAEARAMLMLWARLFWPGEDIRTGADIKRAAPDSELATLVSVMDQLLYGRMAQTEPWDGKQLQRVVQKLRTSSRQADKRSRKGILPPLYKNKP